MAKGPKATVGDIAVLAIRQQGLCLYCAAPLRPGRGTDHHPGWPRATLEHILAKSWGGPKIELYNLALACLECNQHKGWLEGRILANTFKTPDDDLYPPYHQRLRFAPQMALSMTDPTTFAYGGAKQHQLEGCRIAGWRALPHVLEVLARIQQGE